MRRLGGTSRRSWGARRGASTTSHATTRTRSADRSVQGSSRRYEARTDSTRVRPRRTRLIRSVRGSDGAVPGSSGGDDARPGGTRLRRRRTRLIPAGRRLYWRYKAPTALYQARPVGTTLVLAVQGSDGAVPGSSGRDDARPGGTRLRRRRTRLVPAVRGSDGAVPGSSGRDDACPGGTKLRRYRTGLVRSVRRSYRRSDARTVVRALARPGRAPPCGPRGGDPRGSALLAPTPPPVQHSPSPSSAQRVEPHPSPPTAAW